MAAQKVKTLDAWVEEIHFVERMLVEQKLLPQTGFSPFQFLNFDEAAMDHQRKKAMVLVDPKNSDMNTRTSSDKMPFHVTYGCVRSSSTSTLASKGKRPKSSRPTLATIQPNVIVTELAAETSDPSTKRH